jgi:pSer/pThr/pTyr-binding forkhead associated (FHA) protein
MGLAEEQEAWLEREGRTYSLQGNCSIGRAPLNTVVLESAQVSRLHAILHSERGGAFWLVDLGSSNGTLLNSRRIHEPVHVRNGDRITIGGSTFIFRQSRSPSTTQKRITPPITAQGAIEDVPCWLLVADLRVSRRLVATFQVINSRRWSVPGSLRARKTSKSTAAS